VLHALCARSVSVRKERVVEDAVASEEEMGFFAMKEERRLIGSKYCRVACRVCVFVGLESRIERRSGLSFLCVHVVNLDREGRK
jgi:hypothetical protein